MLPSGTVTLLFTDIEGSSKLWDAQPEAMREALATHQHALTSAFDDHEGQVVKDKGDGFIVAFPSAPEALSAAIAAQHNVGDTEWPETIGELKIRMALHTGTMEPREGDYHGPDMNRVARLEAAAHGGQIVVSDAARALAVLNLPDQVDLIDLGAHHLRSLSHPEQVFQVTAPGLGSDFPPLQTLTTAHTSVPTYPTTFVGREPELVQIAQQLDNPDCHLLTLVGAGGMGKTRLAVATAERVAMGRPHGAHFVGLAPVPSAELILAAVADSLGFNVDLHMAASFAPTSQILDYLSHYSMLLVLDNLEHLEGADQVLTEILEHAPDLQLLVTSRQRVDIQAEWIFDVGGMRFPTDVSTDDIDAFSALKLFLDRARRHDSGFKIDDAVVRICQLVGGMPLAVELAAGWVPMLPASEIADEIAKNLDFLEASASDVDERHRSVRAVFDYSWSMLTDDRQGVLGGLSVFSAPFSREAAEAVADADLRSLTELVAKSLVRRESEGRFDLHPLLRQYASGQLSDEESHDAHNRHARFFVGRLLDRTPDLKGSEDQISARDELAVDLDNLQAAAEWAAVSWTEEEVLEMLGALEDFYVVHGWYEGREAFQRIADRIAKAERIDRSATPPEHLPYLWAALSQSQMAASVTALDEAEEIVRAQLPVWERLGGEGLTKCRSGIGIIESTRGNNEAALEALGPVYERLEELGDDAWPIVVVTAWYGWSHYELGNYQAAKEAFDTGYEAAATAGHLQGMAYLESKLGVVADAEGDHDLAADYHNRAHETFVKMGDIAGQGYTLTRLSWTNWYTGNFDQARRDGLEAMEMFEEINHRWGVATSLCRVGFAELSMEDANSAQQRFTEAFRQGREAELEGVIQYALIGIGRVAAASDDPATAVEIFTHVKGRDPLVQQYLDDFADPVLPEIEGQLSTEELEAAQARGAAATLDEIAALVG